MLSRCGSEVTTEGLGSEVLFIGGGRRLFLFWILFLEKKTAAVPDEHLLVGGPEEGLVTR